VKPLANAALVVKGDYEFHEGLFSGYDPATRTYDRSTSNYNTGPDGFKDKSDCQCQRHVCRRIACVLAVDNERGG